MTIYNKIYGGAGCGKTYHLMEELGKLIKSDVDVHSIAMMTLTRAARKEFITRAIKLAQCDEESLTWFGTMHQLTWRMLKLDFKENAITNKLKKAFFENYEKEPSGKLPNIIKINEVRRNCMEPNNKQGLLNTQKITGLKFLYRKTNGKYDTLKIGEITAFAQSWDEFLTSEDLYDFTKMIEVTHERASGGYLIPSFTYMMVDEFQDFSPLQHALYADIASQVDEVWFVGDDRQVIYRFSGASPGFLLNDMVTPGHELILPKTYRYGNEIGENSLKYVERLAVQKERDVSWADREGEVHSLNGSSWKKHLFNDESVTAYLTRTNKQMQTVTDELDARGIIYGLIGNNNSKIETLLKNYNTIAALERGEKVLSDAVGPLLQSLPAAMETKIESQQATISGGFVEAPMKKYQLLRKRLKTDIGNPEYIPSLGKNFFTKEDFANYFFDERWSWDDINLIEHVKGMKEFIHDKKLTFPDPFDMKLQHYVGTIHKFKGNEADNIFLFRQMPYPISDNVLYDPASRDDERRVFYVGATRPRYNLFEIDGFFKDYFGDTMMSVGEIL